MKLWHVLGVSLVFYYFWLNFTMRCPRVTNGVNSLDPALQTKQETLMACGMSPPTQSSSMSSAGSLDVNR